MCPFEGRGDKQAINSLGSGKAPRPDDFTISFYKNYWHLIKKDILDVFEDLHRKGIINKNVNNTLIALIGKKENYHKTSDYRPISLTTSLYKIIAKTLATRLKETLKESIAENQMAFVEGREITDAILIANKAIDYWKVEKIKGFVLKLDIEKAFDTIN